MEKWTYNCKFPADLERMIMETKIETRKTYNEIIVECVRRELPKLAHQWGQQRKTLTK